MKTEEQNIDYPGYFPVPKTVEDAVDYYIEYRREYDFHVCNYKAELIETSYCEKEVLEKCKHLRCSWCEEVVNKYCEGCRECLEEGNDDGKDEY